MSEAIRRLRAAIVDVLTEDVRQALREGRTIAQVMTAYPATKRFVEEQRAFLRLSEGLADTRRNDTGTTIAKMEAGGKTSAEIMKALKITRSTLHYHRRKNKKSIIISRNSLTSTPTPGTVRFTREQTDAKRTRSTAQS